MNDYGLNLVFETKNDDFYLQWMNIYMWKLKFDVKSQLEKELNKQLEEYYGFRE